MLVLATDPPVSEAQRRAMYAAASGHSTLGIPKKVGQEFVGKDLEPEPSLTAAPPPAKMRAAGIMFTTPDSKALFLRRASGGDHVGEWCFPGGKLENGEDAAQAARREAVEETGYEPASEIALLNRETSPAGVDFSTFRQHVGEEFEPTLDDEHDDYAWAPLHEPPSPLHPGVDRLLRAGYMTGDAAWNEASHPRDEQGRWFHGTRTAFHDPKSTKPLFLTNRKDQAWQYAKGVHLGGSGTAQPHVKRFELKNTEAGKIADISSHVDSALEEGEDIDEAMERAMQEAKAAGARYVTYEHPNAGREGEHTVRISMYPHEDITHVGTSTREKPSDAHDAADTTLLALDRDTVRSYRDGHLHVAKTNISKANVCPYQGREIPDYEALGLDPNRIYQLLRDPEELRKAVPTANNVQLLNEHVPVTSTTHRPENVIGSTGTDAEYEHPYLRNSLVVWPQHAIRDVESQRRQELSCGYRYRADMTPGEYEGVHYDGVMRDIRFNHVALVTEGRAGADVVVGDSKLNPEQQETSLMATPKKKPAVPTLSRQGLLAGGAIIAYLRPRLAQDAKLDVRPLLKGVTAKNFKASKPALVDGITKLCEGKLGQDAKIEDLAELLDVLEAHPDAIDEEAPAPAPVPLKQPVLGAPDADPLAGYLRGKGMSEDDVNEACNLAKPKEAADADKDDDEDKDDKGNPFAKGKDEQPDAEKEAKDKKAMDTTIKAAVKLATDSAIKEQRDIREAERAVRPYVGDLNMAFDTAGAVYRKAIEMRGFGDRIKDVPDSALPTILSLLPKPGEQRTGTPSNGGQAHDAAAAKSWSERFPDIAPVRVV